MSQRLLYLTSALVTLATAILYLSIASTRLTNANYGSDGGDLLAAVLTRGIPHPTGYPTYVLLGKIFQLIPLGTPVFKAALESLIPIAVAAGLLSLWVGYVLSSSTVIRLIPAALAGIAWGVAPLIFSQAVIVEVHGLQSLFIVLVLWWATLNLDYIPGSGKKWLLGLSLLVGLGFGNHLTIILLLPIALFALLYLLRKTGSWGLVLAEVSLVFAGALVYLYLPLAAYAYPAINWGNPQTWSGFLWEVTANPYRGFFFGANAPELLDRVRSISSLFVDQFGALGLLAGVVGAIQYPFRLNGLRWTLVWTFFAFLVFATIYHTDDSFGYLIPAFMVFAIWIALAVPAIWALHWKKVPIGVFLVTLLSISILVPIPSTINQVDPRLQDQPARYAEQLLKEAPPNSIIYTTTDQDSFPLWYYHFGLRERPDLRIIVLPLTQFVWYQQTIVRVYPGLNYPAFYAKDQPSTDWGIQISKLNSDSPVCNTRLSGDTPTGVAFQCSLP